MLKLHSIQAFQEMPANLQGEVQKALKTKARLDNYLLSLNKKDGGAVNPSQKAHWEPCKKCSTWGHPGWAWYEERRDSSDIHPSQINKCLKTLWYPCNGYADKLEEFIDPRLRLIFDIGHAWHDTVQRYGRHGAWCDPAHYHPESKIDPNTVDKDGNPLLHVAHKYWIRGSADALIDQYLCPNVPGLGDVSVKLVHEYKTINSNGYSKLTRPKPEHKFQATIYSACFDAPIVVYLYTNKDNCQTADFPVPFDYTIWKEITSKIEKVQYYTNANQEPPWEETSAIHNQQECMECGYRKICAPPMVHSANSARRFT